MPPPIVCLAYQVGEILLAQHAPAPVLDQRSDVGQQAQVVVWRQDGHPQQITEADENEEMLQVGPLTSEHDYGIVEEHAVERPGRPLAQLTQSFSPALQPGPQLDLLLTGPQPTFRLEVVAQRGAYDGPR